jgi:hypothetical protein
VTLDWLLRPPQEFEGETPPGQPARVARLPDHVVRNNPPVGPTGAAADEWVPLGPSVVLDGQADLYPRVSGRVRTFAVSDDGQRIYAGTALGGLWYSGDAGQRWLALDFYASTTDLTGTLTSANALAVGAVAVAFGADASQDTVYVGTGEQKERDASSLPGDVAGVGIRVAKPPNAAVPASLANGPAADPWTLEATNLAREAVVRIVVAPFGVFAATTAGLFRRPAGGGAQWAAVDTGLGTKPFSDVVVVAEGGTQRLYASTADGHVAWSTDGQDGSAHWHAVTLPAFPSPVLHTAATERKLADALLDSGGVTAPTLAAISEDALTPDANWLVATSNNVATSVRVGFPTPTGAPAREQWFAAAVRKTATSGSGTPLARIDLYENGTLKVTGTEQPVTGANPIYQRFDLDAPIALADPTGAGIEARVVTTPSGGASAAARAAVDIGAVMWHTVTYLKTGDPARIKLTALAAGNTPNHAVVYVLADGPRLWRIQDSTAARVLGAPFDLFGDAIGGSDQATYDMAIAVHPSADPVHRDRVVVGGSAFLSPLGEWNASAFSARLVPPVALSTDWTFPANVRRWIGAGAHADVHDFAWVPGTGGNDELWMACDGGVFRSRPVTPPAPNDAWPAFAWEPRNDGLATVEAIYLAQHDVDPSLLLVGTQDNGAQLRIGPETWREPRNANADAGGVAIDPNNPRQMLAQSFNTGWRRSIDGGVSFSTFSLMQSAPAGATAALQSAYADARANEEAQAAFYCMAAVVRGAGTTTQLAIATNRVWYSENWGTSWRTLPTGNDPYDNTIAGAPRVNQDILAVPDHDTDGRIVALRWAGPDRLYAMTSQGIWRLDRTAGAWQPPVRLYDGVAVAASHKRKNAPPSDQIPDDTPLGEIAVHDPAAGTLYAGTSGSGRQHVWFYDGTAHWHSAGLPVDSPAFAIVVDPAHRETVYVGTSVGVWRGRGTFPAGGNPTWTWEHYSNGLPEAACVDLVIHGPARVLRAALRGRGIWEIALDGVVQGPEAYVRAHPFDTRRGPVPNPAGNDPLSNPAAPLRLDASPDVRVWRAPGQPIYAPAPPNTANPFHVWRLQAALAAAGARVQLHGEFDATTQDALRARKAALHLAATPVLNPAIWRGVLRAGTPEANPLPFGAVPDHAALAGLPPVHAGPFRDEPDEAAGAKASCATSNQARVFVVLHSRFWRSLPANQVWVALLRTRFMGNADLSGTAALPAGWAAAVRGDMTAGTHTAFGAGAAWSYASATPTQPLATTADPLRTLGANRPQVVAFDVNLAQPSFPASGWLLLAVVHAADDPLVDAAPTDVAALVRTDHHVAARSVRHAP